MKRTVLITLLSFVTVCSYAQGGMYGFLGGVGYSTGYQSKITPAFEAYYLKKLTHRFSVGGSLFFQKYSFKNTLIKDAGNLQFGDVLNISQKSSYLFFCPKIDFGIGYRKYVHAHVAFGPGVYMGGRQYTSEYQPYWTASNGSNYGADTTAYNTSYNIPKVIFRTAIGLSERLPTYRYWNILLSEEFSYLPGDISRGNPAMHTAYLSFGVGIMHSYPQVLVEY